MPMRLVNVRSRERLLLKQDDSGQDSSWEDAFLLDALLVAMPDAFILYNLEGRPLRWNKAYKEFTGYSDDEISTMNAMEFHPEEDVGHVAEAFGKVVQTGNPMYIETNVLNKSGRAIPCSLSGSVLKDADGKPVGLLGVGRDISERKQAEDALRTMSSAVESSISGIAMSDLDGNITYVNDSFLAMWGYSDRTEVLGKLASSFWQSPEDAERVLEDVLAKTIFRGELVARRKDGSTFPAQLSTNIITDELGNPSLMMGSFVDITGRRKAEEELRKHRENLEELVEKRTTELAEANRQLEERIVEKEEAEEDLLKLNRELDAYAHTVSHELRNPLSGIYLAVEWLERLAGESGGEQIGPEIERVARQVKESVVRSEEHIKDLLALAEAGQEPVATGDVDLKEVVEDILDSMREDLEKRSIVVRVDDDLGSVHANQTQMHQLFSNLIDNAVKHNPGRDLKIKVSFLGDDGDGGHRYLFRDNGSGVAPENMDKIFQPFYSGTNETGIGLATVAKIVKVYGGSITAYNDDGACFEFVLRDYTRE